MTEMNDRLALFMRSEQLTAAKLAEIVQVQPSSISHLLSGRNKPNFEFVSRLMRMFPELNPDWLINGIGTMYRSKQAEIGGDGPKGNASVETTHELPENKPENRDNQSVPYLGLFDTNVNAEDGVTMESSPSSGRFDPVGVNDPQVVSSDAASPLGADVSASSGGLPANGVVGVRHVVVLFDDQTCCVYQNRTTK